MNFHPFYRNDKEVARREEFYTNYVTVKFPADIFTQKNISINKVTVNNVTVIWNLDNREMGVLHSYVYPPGTCQDIYSCLEALY